METEKAVLLFLVLFASWQVLYLLGLDTLLAYWIVLSILVAYLVIDKQTLSKLGLRKTSSLVGAVTTGSVLAIVFVISLFALGLRLYSSAPIDLRQPEISTINLGALTVPYVAVLALTIGVVEESSFRGYILRKLMVSFRPAMALILSAVLFGLYHLSFFYIYYSPLPPTRTFTYWGSFVLEALIGGIFLGYLYIKTEQTIVGPITYHSMSIFIQSFAPFALAFSTSEGHLLLTLVSVVTFVPLITLFRKIGWLHASLTDKVSPAISISGRGRNRMLHKIPRMGKK